MFAELMALLISAMLFGLAVLFLAGIAVALVKIIKAWQD